MKGVQWMEYTSTLYMKEIGIPEVPTRYLLHVHKDQRSFDLRPRDHSPIHERTRYSSSLTVHCLANDHVCLQTVWK